jgi:DNA-binding NarL/FixJ family response regulator
VRTRPGLPVLITSGYVTEDLLAAAERLGVKGVLQKEYTLDQLADMVRQALSDASLAGCQPPPLPAGTGADALRD